MATDRFLKQPLCKPTQRKKLDSMRSTKKCTLLPLKWRENWCVLKPLLDSVAAAGGVGAVDGVADILEFLSLTQRVPQSAKVVCYVYHALT
ncbi:hypothetical protein MRX96_031894 [Rhipicephalus microplus]